MGAWNGSMRTWRDVSIEVDETAGAVSVVSDSPGVINEVLTLGLLGPEGQLDLRVRVVESNPQIVDGIVRHRLKLQMLGVGD